MAEKETEFEAGTCQTCLYMATHEKCDGCLGNHGLPYDYAYYERGDWWARVRQFECDGRRNIVIGGQGEAEVNVNWTTPEALKSLHHVACECGYLVSLRGNPLLDARVEIRVCTTEGHFRINYDGGKMVNIERHNEKADTWRECWPL